MSGLLTLGSEGVAEHIGGDASDESGFLADVVDAILHFVVPPVASLYGVGCRWRQFVVEKREGLFQVG